MQRTTVRTCVMSGGYAHYGDGTVTPMREHVARDLSAILSGTLARFDTHCTIVVDEVPAAVWAAQSDQVRAAGWKHSQVKAWTLFHRADGRTVALGSRADMDPKQLGVLVERNTDPGALALVLDRYNRVAGINWRGTCSLSALAALRLTWENDRYQPLWNHAKTGPGYATGPLVWSRELNENEREWGYVHTFDANAAYLGSAISAELCWSSLHPTGPMPFDHKLPGYWLVQLGPEILAWESATDGRPPLFGRGRVRDGRVWLTTPYARLVEEIGGPLQVLDSWTGRAELRQVGTRLHPAASRVLRKFGEQMRDARAAVDALPAGTLRDVLALATKRTYKDLTGAIQREGMRVFRPDWAHTLIDLWRATMMRRIIAVHRSQGVWPVEVKTDSVSYADCVPEQGPARLGTFGEENLTRALRVDSCQLGCGCSSGRLGQLGAYKHQAVTTTAAWMAARKPKGRWDDGKGPLAFVGGDRAAVGDRKRPGRTRAGAGAGSGTQRRPVAAKPRKRAGAKP